MTTIPAGTGRGMASVLAEVGGWGPFFAVETHRAAAIPAPPWRSMRELFDDPAVLAGRVAAVRSYLGTDRASVRVAASATQFGLVARLISPALGSVVHSGSSPAMDLDGLWWQPEPGSMFPLSVEDGRAGTMAELLDGPVRDLGESMRVFSVSERVLWGNVASAINGAATAIGTVRPDLAGRAIAVADGLLDRPPLRHTGMRHADGRFQRRSCCLIYQAAPAGGRGALCGDCVLAGPQRGS